eukprot:2768232-Rhodomonas_salina.1
MAAIAHGFSPSFSLIRGAASVHSSCPRALSRSDVQGAFRASPLGLRMAGDAKATKSRYTYISKPAGKIGFLVNIWKNEAENQRGRGWLSSTEEEMIELQRVAATSQQLQEGMRTIMQKAVAEKAAEANGGVMPDSIPEYIVNLNVIVAISGGFGSACALYTKKEDWLEIEYLVANTQMDGQFDAQKDVVKHLVGPALCPELTLAALRFECPELIRGGPVVGAHARDSVRRAYGPRVPRAEGRRGVQRVHRLLGINSKIGASAPSFQCKPPDDV